MIDEAVRPELEELLRTTLDEMIPKLVSARTEVIALRPSARPRSLRRTFIAATLAAAVVAGLIAVATRDFGGTTPSTDTAPRSTGEPSWYAPLRSALPQRFDRLALTQATDTRVWFMGMDQSDGKALEVQLSLDLPSYMAVIETDPTGRWEETPQGYRVVTGDQMMVSVSCDIGAQGRDFPGPPNYCDLSSAGAFTKADIHAVVVKVAAAFDRSIFTSNIDPPVPVAVDAGYVKDRIAAAVPNQHLIADTDWGPADRVFDFASDGEIPATSVRIVQGVWPRPPVIRTLQHGRYDGAAAFWTVTPDGLAIRVSVTDPYGASVDRLQQLAYELAGIDLPSPSSATSTIAGPATTVSQGFQPAGGVTYYDTEQPMPVWPAIAQSDPAPFGTGYGMWLCDSSSWTKFASISSAAGVEHSYQGTLCTFTTLRRAVLDAVASCSSMSPETDYAQCRISSYPDDRSPSSEPIAHHLAEEKMAGLSGLHQTSPDEPQPFGDQLSSSVTTGTGYSDASVDVYLVPGTSAGETCFIIAFTEWSSGGCLDVNLLTTGLAYGAFQDRDGAIEVVGIVPDDVATVQIAGHVIAAKNNVWHYTAQSGEDLGFTVSSADGSVTASLA